MSKDYNIHTALNEIYEARLALSLLGKVVDHHDTGEIGFEITGAGPLIENQAERIYDALQVLEEQYKLHLFEDEIQELHRKYMEDLHEKVGRFEQRMDIARKHNEKAEEEVREQGLDPADDPDHTNKEPQNQGEES